MHFFSTKQGTFWIIESESRAGVILGIEETVLAHFEHAEQAANAVQAQCTGHYAWDVSSRVKLPENLNDWRTDPPSEWENWFGTGSAPSKKMISSAAKTRAS